MMTNNYNAIAGWYDVLSRLIFQKSIVNAQLFLLQQITAGSNILIVGGGTGWILEELATIHAQNISITYVEKSVKMLALSRKRNCKNNSVEFINTAIEEYKTGKKFDVIITAFLFDNFGAEKIQVIFSRLNKILKPNGLWLYADFIHDTHEKLWKRFLLKTMYFFFKLTCNIETQQLVNMDNCFAQHYTKIGEALFYKNFIQSKVYQKISIE